MRKLAIDINYNRQTDYLLDNTITSIISDFVKSYFTADELKALSEAINNLTSMNIKQAEKIETYRLKFSSKLTVYEKIIDKYNQLFEIIKTKTDSKICEQKELLISNEFANQIRVQQEKMKITKNKLNETKFVIIKKIVQLSRKNRKL